MFLPIIGKRLLIVRGVGLELTLLVKAQRMGLPGRPPQKAVDHNRAGQG